MTSEILDQAALDALLSQASMDPSKAATMSFVSVGDNSSALIDEVANAFSSTLSSLTQKEVAINKESEEVSSLDKLAEKFEGKVVVGQSKLTKDIEGEFAFVIDNNSASVISDLVLMGEGEAKEELTPDDIDALNEMMNQLCGASSQQITEVLGKKTSCEQSVLSVIDVAEKKSDIEKLFQENKIFLFTFALKIADLVSTNLYIIVNAGIEDCFTTTEPEPAVEPESDAIIEGAQKGATDISEQAKQYREVQEEENSDDFSGGLRNIELIKGIEVDVKIKLGDTIMPLKKVIKLIPGTIIELNKNVDANLELVVNGKSIAEGVLVVVSSNNFALRVTKILDQTERIKSLAGGAD